MSIRENTENNAIAIPENESYAEREQLRVEREILSESDHESDYNSEESECDESKDVVNKLLEIELERK